MKKVLALVLVTIMAFGMIVPATAATVGAPKPTGLAVNTLGFGYTYSDSYVGYKVIKTNLGYSLQAVQSGKTSREAGALNATGTTVSYSEDIRPHDEVDDFINLYVGMFTWEDSIIPAYRDILISWDTRVKGYETLPTGTKLVRYDSATEKYVDVTDYGFLAWTATGNLVTSTANIAAKEIRTGKIGVRTSVAAGSKAIENVSIDTKAGVIEINYVDEYVSTKELDFEFTVYLTFNNKRWTDEGLTFVGTLANEVIEVYENDDYVDTSNGAVAHAQEFVKAIEVDLGNGVSIHTKFFKDKKYYGTSTRDADEEDDVVFAKYPDVDNVVTLKTVGLNSTGDIVKLDTDYSDYFVYDVNMNYLGQSNEMLPYSTKYYLANRKLDVDTVPDEVDDGSAPVVEGTNPDMGGDDIAASNPNANPGTGR